MKFRLLLLFLALLAGVAAQTAEPELYVGALEDVAGYEGHYNAVRAVFRKTGREWLPFPAECAEVGCLQDLKRHFPDAVTWDIGFSGRYLGQLKSQLPGLVQAVSEVGLQNVVSGKVPKIGKRSLEYGGFIEQPVYRPLVAISEKSFRDPDNWRRAQPSAKMSARLRHAFRQRFPAVSNCKSIDDEKALPWAYRDGNIKLERFYASNRGWSVAEVALQQYRCDGPPDDAFIDQWFAVSPKGDVTYLEGGMHLLDAGDYDGDGKSEIMFTIDRYNEGGYTLYYDDFRRHATFNFHYQ